MALRRCREFQAIDCSRYIDCPRCMGIQCHNLGFIGWPRTKATQQLSWLCEKKFSLARIRRKDRAECCRNADRSCCGSRGCRQRLCKVGRASTPSLDRDAAKARGRPSWLRQAVSLKLLQRGRARAGRPSGRVKACARVRRAPFRGNLFPGVGPMKHARGPRDRRARKSKGSEIARSQPTARRRRSDVNARRQAPSFFGCGASGPLVDARALSGRQRRRRGRLIGVCGVAGVDIAFDRRRLVRNLFRGFGGDRRGWGRRC
jgi:hypothetical protein